MHKKEKAQFLKHQSTEDEITTDWWSIYVASILSFVGSAQYSIYFSVLWPYLQILDRHATETFFGYIVSIYSLGQIFSAPTFGYWSNKIKQVRLPLFVGLGLMFAGNISYIMLEIVYDMSSTYPKYLLLIGRFLTGMGSGNVALLRTYASTASTDRDRHKAIAYVTCGQAMGNTAGPALQLMLTSLRYPGIHLFSHLKFNMYTAPAYFACAMNIFGAIILYCLFKEAYAGVVDEDEEEESKKLVEAKETPHKLPPYDKIAVSSCYVTRFTQMFINTNLETIGSPFAMMMFAWPEPIAVRNTAAVQGIVGIFTLLNYIAYICFKMEKFINFRMSCMFALTIMILFHLVTYSWPFLPNSIVLNYNSELINSTDQNVGCNVNKFTWCESLAQVNVWIYFITYIIAIGIALPTMNITMTTLFSKILGPRRQGTQQGVLQMFGSGARMVGPIAISTLYSDYGPRMAWMMEIVVISSTLLLWCIFYRRMVPLRCAIHSDYEIISTDDKSMKSEKTVNNVV